ncbi:MAG: hypothetical protein ABI051_05460 [Vicinamibacterales bacterium]
MTCLLVAVPLLAQRDGVVSQIMPPPPPPPPPPSRDATLARTQAVPIGTGSLGGTVVAADTGRPIRGARVTVSGTASGGSAPAGAAPAGARNVVGGIAGGSTVTLGAIAQSASSGPGLTRNTITDEQGQFLFEAMPSGQFTVNAILSQYLPLAYGQKGPGRQPAFIRMAEGQRVSITLPMQRGGVITGTVYGEDGAPAVNAQVRLLRYVSNAGMRRLQQTGGSSTDDRGVYRAFGLTPGDYIVATTPQANDMMLADRVATDAAAFQRALAAARASQRPGSAAPSVVTLPASTVQMIDGRPVEQGGFAPTYYPSAISPGAAMTVAVSAGEERSGVDIRVVLVRAGSVTGTAFGAPEGTRVQIAMVNESPEAEQSYLGAQVGLEGRFFLRNVAPGQYTVFAQTVPVPSPSTNGSYVPPPPLTGEQRLWAKASVFVDGQSSPSVDLVLQPGRSISGTVALDMASRSDASRRMTVALLTTPGPVQLPQYGPLPEAVVDTEGRFAIPGVGPGRYTLRITGGGVVRSAIVNGEDILDAPLVLAGDRDVTGVVITVTDKPSGLTGTLSDASGSPAADYSILLVPAESRYWTPGSRRIQMTRPDMSGRYTFRTVPAGDYLLAAVSDIEPGAQYDPEFLKTLAGAALRVSIAESAVATQNIRVSQ